MPSSKSKTLSSKINFIKQYPQYQNKTSQKPININGLDELAVITEARKENNQNDLIWLSLSNPTNEELNRVLPGFVKQARILDEVKSKHTRPKVVEYENASLVVAITVHSTKGVVRFGESQILFGEGFVLSIWRHTELTDESINQYLEESLGLIARGADYVVAEILDYITDDYGNSLQVIEKQVESAEKNFFTGESERKDIERVYQLRRTLLRVQGGIAPLAELARRFMRQNVSYIGADSRAYFYEVADRIDRQAEAIRALRETLAFAFEAGMMLIELQQTGIARKLAAWAAILAIPTAVAGIYGMNFTHMPELEWLYAYPAVLGGMGLVCGGLYKQFKRIGWL